MHPYYLPDGMTPWAYIDSLYVYPFAGKCSDAGKYFLQAAKVIYVSLSGYHKTVRQPPVLYAALLQTGIIVRAANKWVESIPQRQRDERQKLLLLLAVQIRFALSADKQRIAVRRQSLRECLSLILIITLPQHASHPIIPHS